MKDELRQLAIFSEFSDEPLEYLLAHSRAETYQPNQVIHEGEPSRFFGFCFRVRGATQERARRQGNSRGHQRRNWHVVWRH
jgi:hypothetical protein